MIPENKRLAFTITATAIASAIAIGYSSRGCTGRNDFADRRPDAESYLQMRDMPNKPRTPGVAYCPSYVTNSGDGFRLRSHLLENFKESNDEILNAIGTDKVVVTVALHLDVERRINKVFTSCRCSDGDDCCSGKIDLSSYARIGELPYLFLPPVEGPCTVSMSVTLSSGSSTQ